MCASMSDSVVITIITYQRPASMSNMYIRRACERVYTGVIVDEWWYDVYKVMLSVNLEGRLPNHPSQYARVSFVVPWFMQQQQKIFHTIPTLTTGSELLRYQKYTQIKVKQIDDTRAKKKIHTLAGNNFFLRPAIFFFSSDAFFWESETESGWSNMRQRWCVANQQHPNAV